MFLFESLFQLFHLMVEVIEAVNLQVIADTTTIGRDGFVMGDAVKAEELLQAGEVSVGNADRLFVGKPFLDIIVIGLATLGSTLASNEDEFDVITLGNLLAQVLAALNG